MGLFSLFRGVLYFIPDVVVVNYSLEVLLIDQVYVGASVSVLEKALCSVDFATRWKVKNDEDNNPYHKMNERVHCHDKNEPMVKNSCRWSKEYHEEYTEVNEMNKPPNKEIASEGSRVI
jgi:hypothetical protein